MYNSVTEEKIKQIPGIGTIDVKRLPQELTRIYAQIVNLRRQVVDGNLNFQSSELLESLEVLQALANNLETIILTFPKHEQKESIAFVAATAHSLISKLSADYKASPVFDIATISFYISGIILFLIGNSQADAAEMAINFNIPEDIGKSKKKLARYVQALAKGKLSEILNDPPSDQDINFDDLQETALDYLWRELSLGIFDIAAKLTGREQVEGTNNSFEIVLNLSVDKEDFLGQKNVLSGPYHLAKLLRILKNDILARGVINIPPPVDIDSVKWKDFLDRLSLQRPYLWENHMDAVNTKFLNNGISSVLTLPTGAGKSTLSELKIAACLISGKKVIYLVPTHALEDQVNNNLKTFFKDHNANQTEIDAEYTELVNSDSSLILVMTPERCLTFLTSSPDDLKNFGLIVFDEFHLIHGTKTNFSGRPIDAMYCLISLFTLAPQADYLLISAMVENGAEIKEWIEAVTGRECRLFNSSWKPTRQLHGCLVFEQNEVDLLNNRINLDARSRVTKAPSAKLKRAMSIAAHCFYSLQNVWDTDDDSDYFRAKILDENIVLGVNQWWKLTTNRNDIAARLAAHFSEMGLKTLVFVDDPKIAVSTASKINGRLGSRTNNHADYLKANAKALNGLAQELGDMKYSYFENGTNVGVHHGLLLPLERGLIERYFKEADGSIALVATTTLAQGINLPAEIVIIAGDDRFDIDSEKRESVKPHELLNAAGRAGRAGQSSQGAVILIPGEIVTIENSSISSRWWALKNEVFSQSDQCLKIEDPLQYFLDSIQDDSKPLDSTQQNILFKFKSEKLSETETKLLISRSFSAFNAVRNNKLDSFNGQVAHLLKRRNELDLKSDDIIWVKEISFKTGIDPNLILQLANAIDSEDFHEFINLSVVNLIDWFFDWLQKSESYINQVYIKQSTINQIMRAVGLKPGFQNTDLLIKKLPIVKTTLTEYVKGANLEQLNNLIPNTSTRDNTKFLINARNFVIRLIPEISFSFGLLSMIIIEKSEQKNIDKKAIPLTIRTLASCIREGFDTPEKLYYKKSNPRLQRVEVHKHIN